MYCCKFMNLCGGVCFGVVWILFIDSALNLAQNSNQPTFEWYFTISMIVNTVGMS